MIDLHVELTDDAVGMSGHKKQRFGYADILLSVKAAVDVVSRKKALEDLKDYVEAPKRAPT